MGYQADLGPGGAHLKECSAATADATRRFQELSVEIATDGDFLANLHDLPMDWTARRACAHGSHDRRGNGDSAQGELFRVLATNGTVKSYFI